MQGIESRFRLPIRRRVNLGFTLAIGLLAAVAVLSYQSVGRLVETDERVGQTQRALAALESLLAGTTAAESSVRGYALTGDDRFLEGHEAGGQRAQAALVELKGLTADDPEQQRRLARLEPLIGERLLSLQETVALRQEQGPAAAAERVRASSGSVVDAATRALIDETRAVEHALLRARVAAAAATASRTRWIILAGGGVLVTVTLGSIALIGREIGRRRRVDRGRRAVEVRYRTLFDRNLVAIARSRLDGTMLDCNTALVRLLGYTSREEVLGTNASQLYADPAERERLVSGFQPGEGIVDHEVRFRRKDGEVIWVSMTFVEFEEDGQPGFEALMLDITDRKTAARQIETLNAALEGRVGELDAANQELDAFSYSISHDLRAPLRAMQGFAEALLEDYGARLDPTGHDYAQRIVAASRQMDALIQDLLANSRL